MWFSIRVLLLLLHLTTFSMKSAKLAADFLLTVSLLIQIKNHFNRFRLFRIDDVGIFAWVPVPFIVNVTLEVIAENISATVKSSVLTADSLSRLNSI